MRDLGCFHFQLNWLSTSQLVDELTRAYARMIDRYGLRLVFCAALQAKGLHALALYCARSDVAQIWSSDVPWINI